MDPLVAPFMRAADETRARDELGELLLAHASPVVGPIVRRQLAFAGASRVDREREDLQSTVLRSLTARLWALKRGELTTPIVNLPAYAASAAYSACQEWLRRRAPHRASLQSCTRYVLTHDPRLSFRDIADRDWSCAAVDARDRAIVSEKRVREVASAQVAALRGAVDGGDPSASPAAFATFVRATLEALQRPCRFVTLVTVLADCLGQTGVIADDRDGNGDGDGAPPPRHEEEPPGFDEIAAYVDGTLNDVDRGIVETRLEADSALRIEVDDLLMLREAMGQTFAAPALTPAAPALTPAAPAPTPAALAPTLAAPAPAPATASPAPASRTPVAPPGRARATSRSTRPSWMMATFATASAAVVVILAVAWSNGGASTKPAVPGGASSDRTLARLSPPTPSPASDSAPPASSGGAAPVSVSAPLTASVIAIRDAGRIITVDSGGRLQGVPDAMSTQADMVRHALRAGTLPGAAAHKGLGQPELTPTGPNPDDPVDVLTVLAPLGTVVRELQPTFRWAPYPDARSYVVIIYSDAFDIVLSSPPVRDTAWRATSPLKPGATYLWQVTARTPGGPVHAPTPPAPDARFRVIADDARRTLDRDLATAGSSRLLGGLLFAAAGLLDDAEQAFTALAKENPDSEPITRLLSGVRERKKQE